MDRDVLDTIEREIDQEVRARFPGSAVRQAVLLQYGDDPEIEPGDLWVRVLLDAGRAGGQLGAGPDGIRASQQDGDRAVHGATWQQSSGRSGWSSTRSATTPSPATARDPARACPSRSGCRTSRSGSTARLPLCWPRWDRLAWKRWTR